MPDRTVVVWMLSDDGTSKVDVLTLEDFRSTLEGRLVEAESVRTSLVAQLRRVEPRLGDLPDAEHVRRRYASLYDQHLDRVTTLIGALTATRDALTVIIDNYQTNEARLTADAADIAAALGEVSGVHHGENAYAE